MSQMGSDSSLRRCPPLDRFAIFLGGKASDITAWSRQALDIAGTNRVGDDREHDRNGAGHLPQRAAAPLVKAMMTSGPNAINSIADVRVRLASPAPQRVFAAVGPAQLL
jgi:hypothetical protein